MEVLVLEQKFKEIVDRMTIIRISRCLECEEIIHSSFSSADGLQEHHQRTGHDRFEAIGHAYIYASEEDARWMEEYGKLLKKSFEELRRSKEWKEFEKKFE